MDSWNNLNFTSDTADGETRSISVLQAAEAASDQWPSLAALWTAA
jgi:hypothetical protein